MVTCMDPTIRIKHLLVVAAVLASLAISVVPASGEWFADLYAGPASTKKSQVSVEGTKLDPAGDFTTKHQDVDFDASTSFGGRFGYWDETVSWLGVALDVSHFRPDAGRQTAITRETDADGSVRQRLTFARLDISATLMSSHPAGRSPISAVPGSRSMPQDNCGPTGSRLACSRSSTRAPPGLPARSVPTAAGCRRGAPERRSGARSSNTRLGSPTSRDTGTLAEPG